MQECFQLPCLSPQLHDVLHEGCESYAPLPQDALHNLPIGWNILYGHLRAHYRIKGQLRYYAQGETFLIQSSTGVQQVDPLGSLLSALGIHPLLLAIGSRHLSVFIPAYADNVLILGLLSKVRAAVEAFIANLLRAGLVLNPSESAVYIPSWLAPSRVNLTNIPGVSTDEAGCLHLTMTPGTSFPLEMEASQSSAAP